MTKTAVQQRSASLAAIMANTYGKTKPCLAPVHKTNGRWLWHSPCSAGTWSTADLTPPQIQTRSPGRCTRPPPWRSGRAAGCTACTPSSWMPGGGETCSSQQLESLHKEGTFQQITSTQEVVHYSSVIHLTWAILDLRYISIPHHFISQCWKTGWSQHLSQVSC